MQTSPHTIHPIVPTSKREQLFENLPDLLRPEQAASVLGVAVATIYDWRYRLHSNKVPKELFLKLNRFLFLRTDVLRRWIVSQNPILRDGKEQTNVDT